MNARTKSAEDTRALAGEIAALAGPGDIIVLAGDLGSGKTCFAQGFGAGLGVTEQIVSPTFVLVRHYEGATLPLVHADVYRLDTLQEANDLGLGELLDEGAVALVEWGDVVEPALPADFLEVRLERGDDDDERLLRLRIVGPSWARRAAALERAIDRWATGAGSC
jgi:tRNA threonylcarbamoyladenosine biosynthesis protein TsaE